MAVEGARASEVTLVIEPGRVRLRPLLAEAWAYRELLVFLAWRDVKVRYKQTALGAAWAVLQPVLTMLLFSVVFGRLANLPSDGLPYPLFAYAALLPWQLFAHSLTSSSNSLVASQQLITKVYFPRLLIPWSSVLSGLADFAIAFVALIFIMLPYGFYPRWSVLVLPLFVAMAILSALGVGVWLAALNVRYRDVRYAVPFLTQVWLFATPIAYPSSLVPERWRALMGLNPMAGVADGFRWALFGSPPFPGLEVAASGLVVVVVLLTGLIYFGHVEQTMSDVI